LKKQRQLKSAFSKAEQHEYDGGRGLTPVCTDGLHEAKPSLVMPHKVTCPFAAMGLDTKAKAMTNATTTSFFVRASITLKMSDKLLISFLSLVLWSCEESQWYVRTYIAMKIRK